MSDLSLFPENTTHELTHPQTGEPTGLVLELLPPDHDDVYNAGVEAVKALRNTAKDAIEVAVSLERRIKVAATLIAGWAVTSDEWVNVFKKLGFEDASYSHEKAIALLSMKTAGWVRSQIETVIKDKQRFFKSASND